jgi:ankyrin repeat protein
MADARAITAGDAGGIDELLAAGAAAGARRYDGATALMLAARAGRRELVRLLIDAGCDLDVRQWVDRGPTALDAAEAGDARSLARMLVEAGASARTESASA